jgi:hypothetical protein
MLRQAMSRTIGDWRLTLGDWRPAPTRGSRIVNAQPTINPQSPAINPQLAALLVLLCLSVPPTARAQDQPPTETPGVPHIELSSQEWNFGTAWQGQPLKREITVKNVGTAPLEISEVSSSCGCTVPTKPKSPLAPGESSTMTISYDSAKRPGQAGQTVTLVTNDPARHSVPIKLLGEVKPLYDVEPREGLIFGQLRQSSRETRSVTIVNKYTDAFRLELKEGQDFGPFDIQLKADEPGLRYTLSATTRPPLNVNHYQVMVILTTGLELVPQIQVPVYGFVQPPVMVRPTKLFLPKNSVSEMKRLVQLLYAPDYPVEITAVKASHDAIKVTTQKPAPGPDGQPADAYQITVVLPPGEMIPTGAEPTVEITTNAKDPQYQHFVIPIQIVPAPAAHPAAATKPSPAGG